MAGLEWNTVNRLDALGLAGGMGTPLGPRLPTNYGRNDQYDGGILNSLMAGLAGLGAVPQPPNKPAGWPAYWAALAENSNRATRELQAISNLVAQAQQAGYQLATLTSSAQDLASQTTSPSALTLLDRINALASDAEAALGEVDNLYATLVKKIPTRPVILGADGIPRGWIHGGSEEQNAWMFAWAESGDVLDSTANEVRAAAARVTRAVAQITPLMQQIQTAAQKDQQIRAAAEARAAAEQARIDQAAALVQQREDQRYAIEQAKLQNQLQIEQARAQAEMQRLQQQLALEQQQAAALTAPLTNAYQTPAAAMGTAGAPAGYTYDPSSGYYYNPSANLYWLNGQYYYPQGQQSYAAPAQQGVQYAAAPVQYAEQPASWAYQAPNQFIQPQGYQTPAAAPSYLPQGWASMEYEALLEGESRYLHGLGALGAESRCAKPGLGAMVATNPARTEYGPSAAIGGKIEQGYKVFGPYPGGVYTFQRPNGDRWQVPSASVPVTDPITNQVIYQPAGTDGKNYGSSGPSASDIAQIISAAGSAFQSAAPAFIPELAIRQEQQRQAEIAMSQRQTSIGPILGILGVVTVVGGGAYLVSKAASAPTRRRR